MFKNTNHAKKVTKSIFDFCKANPKVKLSEFRQHLASTLSYSFFNDLLNNIHAPQEAKETSILDLLYGDYAVLVNKTSFGNVFVLPDSIQIKYESRCNEHGFCTDELVSTIPLSHLKKAKILGSKIFLKDDSDSLVELHIYLPMNNHQLKITTKHNLITVRKCLASGETEEHSFLNNDSGLFMAQTLFKNLLESSVSNFNEYSEDDIDALWQSGSTSFDSGKIDVIYQENPSSNEDPKIKIAFDSEWVSISQIIQIIDSDYDESAIVEGLKNGSLLTDTWHSNGTELPCVSIAKTGEIVGVVLTQDVNGDYTEFC